MAAAHSTKIQRVKLHRSSSAGKPLVGQSLRRKFRRLGVVQRSGCACRSTERSLDLQSIDDVLRQQWEIADKIVQNARRGRSEPWRAWKTATVDLLVDKTPDRLLRWIAWLLVRIAVWEERRRLGRKQARLGKPVKKKYKPVMRKEIGWHRPIVHKDAGERNEVPV